MSPIITRKRIIIASIILLLAVVIVALLLSQSAQRSAPISISDSKSVQKSIVVDFSKHTSLLSATQQLELPFDLIKRTSSKDIGSSKIEGVIRESSIAHPSSSETTFIIDAEKIQTSFLVSRYIAPDDPSIDIVNITCVPSDQRIYKQDYCYEQ